MKLIIQPQVLIYTPKKTDRYGGLLKPGPTRKGWKRQFYEIRQKISVSFIHPTLKLSRGENHHHSPVVKMVHMWSQRKIQFITMYGLVGKKTIVKPFFYKRTLGSSTTYTFWQECWVNLWVQPIWPPPHPTWLSALENQLGGTGLILPGKPLLSKSEPHRFSSTFNIRKKLWAHVTQLELTCQNWQCLFSF